MFLAIDAVAYTAGLHIQHLPFGCDAEGLVDGCGCTAREQSGLVVSSCRAVFTSSGPFHALHQSPAAHDFGHAARRSPHRQPRSLVTHDHRSGTNGRTGKINGSRPTNPSSSAAMTASPLHRLVRRTQQMIPRGQIRHDPVFPASIGVPLRRAAPARRSTRLRVLAYR